MSKAIVILLISNIALTLTCFCLLRQQIRDVPIKTKTEVLDKVETSITKGIDDGFAILRGIPNSKKGP